MPNISPNLGEHLAEFFRNVCRILPEFYEIIATEILCVPNFAGVLRTYCNRTSMNFTGIKNFVRVQSRNITVIAILARTQSHGCL